MKKLMVFNNVSLDGFITDSNGDMSWAHNPKPDKEWNEFIASNAKGGAILVFGRITYELMAGYWPTAHALQSNPEVAKRMNSLPKIVFSRTLKEASWNNTKLVKRGMEAEIKKLKKEADRDMVIFGSGKLISQLTQKRLIDEYQIVVNPIILGGGKTMFEGIHEKVKLNLTKTRSFKNGNVFLSYKLT